jgi:hypothetical protein
MAIGPIRKAISAIWMESKLAKVSNLLMHNRKSKKNKLPNEKFYESGFK